ncbi:MAG: hypothetical protein Fur0042_29820 [Cyanophyceae cyanobacterium]
MLFSPIIDIAIGLLFIYLIFSLLASELQEILATLLQWRAVHLKRTIEQLLAGGAGGDRNAGADPRVDQQIAEVRQLADRLYESPIVSTLNYEARGLLAGAFRKLFRAIAGLFTLGRSPFGSNNTSGPSYIPSSTFSDALLSTLHLPELVHLVSTKRLKHFKAQLFGSVHKSLSAYLGQAAIAQFVARFEERLTLIVEDYEAQKFTLAATLGRMDALFGRFIEVIESRTDYGEVEDLKVLRGDLFEDGGEYGTLSASLRPSVEEVLSALRTKGEAYQELLNALAAFATPEDPTRQTLERAIAKLPNSVQDSLLSLAQRVRRKTTAVQNDLMDFQMEVEAWYNRAQERAAGVYRRNARGISLLIGIAIAIAVNADTFHMIQSLSADRVLRGAIVTAAEQTVTNNLPAPGQPIDADALRRQVDPILDDLGLPIGWTGDRLQKQLYPAPYCPPAGSETAAPADCQQPSFALWLWIRVRVVFGWIVTGVAISMGAPFWFDLLGKIMKVRSIGQKNAP